MRRLITLIPIALVAACVPKASPPPEPAPRPAPAPAPAPIATPLPTGSDWRDWPVTAGSWTYRQDARGSIALFGQAGADAELTLRCDRQAGQVFLSRRGATPGGAPMTIRTSSLLRSLTVRPTGGNPAYMATALGARDPILDAIGFSRGRFIVELAPMPTLVIPAWAEILRITEDCRG